MNNFGCSKIKQSLICGNIISLQPISYRLAPKFPHKLVNFPFSTRTWEPKLPYVMKQESIPVGCKLPTCQPYTLHNEQIRTCAGGGGPMGNPCTERSYVLRVGGRRLRLGEMGMSLGVPDQWCQMHHG